MIIRNENDVNLFTNNIYEGYSEFETNTILLVEKQGLASFDRQNTIKKMVDYIDEQIAERKENLAYASAFYRHRKGVKEIAVSTSYLIIKIPEEITKEFTCFNNLSIKVKVRDLHGNIDLKNHINTSGGKNTTFKNNCIVNGKLDNVEIEITCNSINGKLIASDFNDAFNHEYNHAYEEYKRFLNKEKNSKIKGGYEINKYVNQDFRLKLLNSVNETEQAFGWILYMLWYNSEFDAWATSSYSFLKGIDSERYNFSDDIKRCDAYVKYKNIKTKYLPIIKNCDNGDLWIYVYNIVTKEKLNIFRNKKEVLNQINSFKKRFIKKTESLADRFWIKLCRTATLYYDEKEKNIQTN